MGSMDDVDDTDDTDHTDYMDDTDDTVDTDTKKSSYSLAHQHVLNVAEEHFLAYGYTGVRLRDITNALGKKHST